MPVAAGSEEEYTGMNTVVARTSREKSNVLVPVLRKKLKMLQYFVHVYAC